MELPLSPSQTCSSDAPYRFLKILSWNYCLTEWNGFLLLMACNICEIILSPRILSLKLIKPCLKQVAQWAMIAHHGANIMFGDTIIYDAQRQVTLNLKQ